MRTTPIPDSVIRGQPSPKLLDVHTLDIGSPKRGSNKKSGWEGFYPYYAGFPESFVDRILKSATPDSVTRVLDPWNGSGTTTLVASRLGFTSIGFDINPVMIIVARARKLASTEADSIEPLGRELLLRAQNMFKPCDTNDPLLTWFGQRTAARIRSIESAIRVLLVGSRALSESGTHLESVSTIAASFYVALFAVCRDLLRAYRSTNPTWLRQLRPGEHKAGARAPNFESRFAHAFRTLALSLESTEVRRIPDASTILRVADVTAHAFEPGAIDLVLTSPPYCTRIDYTAATRIELAIISPLLHISPAALSRSMMGSVRVPSLIPTPSESWGPTCLEFLRRVRLHPSKASAGYYLSTHLDYFSKLDSSLKMISPSLRSGGTAILVVQDSFYKDAHNDLPQIVTEMAAHYCLILRRRDDFPATHVLASAHPFTRHYRPSPRAVESVLCLQKH